MTKILLNYNVGIFNPKCFYSIMKLDFTGTETDVFVNIFNDFGGPQYSPEGIEKNDKWRNIIAKKLNKARNIVIKNDYDYMLSVEHDIIAPENALQELLKYATQDRVVGGIYRLRKLRNKEYPLCYLRQDEKGENAGWGQIEDLSLGETFPVYLVPFGFTLIPKKILQQLPIFDRELDGSYAIELKKKGIERLLVTSVKLEHLDRDGSIYRV